MRIEMGKFCVYVHSIGEKPFYVGCGKHTRPFNLHGRNSIWKGIVRSNPALDITIVSWHDDMESALHAENELLVALDPVANKRKGMVYEEGIGEDGQPCIMRPIRTHGTRGAYNQGCSCRECCEANTEYYRKRRTVQPEPLMEAR